MTDHVVHLMDEFDELRTECADLCDGLLLDEPEAISLQKDLESSLRRLEKRLSRAAREADPSEALLEAIDELVEEVQDGLIALRGYV